MGCHCAGGCARGDVPVLMVTAKGDDVDRIVGLEIGADDYLAKPFNPRELIARVRAILRRTRDRQRVTADLPPERYGFAGWTLDAGAQALADPDGAPVELTGGEFDLLLAFVTPDGDRRDDGAAIARQRSAAL
jgi:two-component system OmpR family response regulator